MDESRFWRLIEERIRTGRVDVFLLQHLELLEIWTEYKGDLNHDTLLNLQLQKCNKDARTRYG